MADEESKAAVTADTSALSTQNNDDTEKPQNNNQRKKEREAFKGKSEKMAGNVFQLAAEGRKANQYTGRYEPLREELKNDFTKGRDEYPTSVTAAYQMLLSRDKGASPSQTGSGKGRHNNNNGGRNGGRGNGSGGGRKSQGRG
jgi:hypothetical protein